MLWSTVINSNSDSVCKTCNKCLIFGNHDACVKKFLKRHDRSSVNRVRQSVLNTRVWKPTGRKFANVGYQWRPTGRTFPIEGQDQSIKGLSRTNKRWIPTSKVIPLSDHHLGTRSIAPTVSLTSVVSECACANTTDLNCAWGTCYFSYPLLSDIKCRSCKSSFGIWTQAAQNI